jgi:hypothetical protein
VSEGERWMLVSLIYFEIVDHHCLSFLYMISVYI